MKLIIQVPGPIPKCIFDDYTHDTGDTNAKKYFFKSSTGTTYVGTVSRYRYTAFIYIDFTFFKHNFKINIDDTSRIKTGF